MGVPAFYRWLVDKYPKVVIKAIEEVGCVDTTQPNPNGLEFDNLYLDMNGIIHPCFHPNDQLFPPVTFDEVFTAIFEYIDRIFQIVRPRKLLYMAVDGVAPRAKMNQQRSRRFRNAKDAEIAEAEEDRLRKEFEREGKEVLPKQEYEVSDSNVITPGTVFMAKLAKALEQYIRSRLNDDPGWKSIKVILSDASVPGEGEHKMMNFIRLQRNLPGYNPNTRHCLYGLDADLIMLALATHEINFFILREDVLKQDTQENVMISFEASLSRKEHDMVKSRQWFRKVQTINGGGSMPKKPYQFLNIWTLREYLEIDMGIPDPPFQIDFERIVDDFVFICFFTGNDFLPHLPSLEIHEGAIDLLIAVYKKMFKSMGGYLVDTARMKDKKAAYINVKRIEKFVLAVGAYQDSIFEKRFRLRQKKVQRLLRERLDEETSGDHFDDSGENIIHEDPYDRLDTKSTVNKFVNLKDGFSAFGGSETILESLSEKCSISTSGSMKSEKPEGSDVLQNTRELKQKLKDFLSNNSDLFKGGVLHNDKVKLGYPGWKSRYYREKFSAGPTEIESTRKAIVEKYVEGLCWVLQYYFAGVCSWTWYYSFYYGPFASDFRAISCPQAKFKIGSPFKPFDQLMAVLPPRSSIALPKAYRELMNNEDSTICKFYPTDFMVDMDGKRFTWQGVCQLPFIEEEPLLTATRMFESELETDEVERNLFKFDKIFVRDSHALGLKVSSIYKLVQDINEITGAEEPIDVTSCEINGFLLPCDECLHHSTTREMEDITHDRVISGIYKSPHSHDHIAELLENLTMPENTITEADIVERKLWHEYKGSQQPQMTNEHRNIPKVKPTLKSSASARETTVGAGFERRGRGKMAVKPLSVGQQYEDVGGSHSGIFGRGNFSVQSDTYSRANWRNMSQSQSICEGRGSCTNTEPWGPIGDSTTSNRGRETNGFLLPCDECLRSSPVRDMEEITKDHVVCAIYKNPHSHEHIAKLLENVTMPEKTIEAADIVERKLWHGYEGSRQPQMTSQQRIPKIEPALKSAAAREQYRDAGFGWHGRGKAAVEPVSVGQRCGDYDDRYAGNFGRGNLRIQSGTYSRGGCRNRSQWISGGRGSYSNTEPWGQVRNTTTNRGYQHSYGGFQQTSRGSMADGSGNWRPSSTPSAGDGGRYCSAPVGSNQRWVVRPNHDPSLHEGTQRGNRW